MDVAAIYKSAVVQAAPVFLDKDGCIEKTCKLIEEAGGNGARLVVFPETYIPTYPYWIRDLVDRTPCHEAFVQLFRNAISVPSMETEILARSAKKADTYVVVGINEVDGGTIYNSNLHISARGKVLGVHRKLMPTFTERAVWGFGDGSTLQVFDTEIGRLGSLVCYEHHMPLVKFAMFSKREQIHAACWPGLKRINHVAEAASRQYAFEGQVFVFASAGILLEDTVPNEFVLREHIIKANGGSAIIDPLGRVLAGPVYDREEILYADIDLDSIVKAKYVIDSVGHYSRSEVAQLFLNEEPFHPVVHRGKDEQVNTEAERRIRQLTDELAQLKEQLKGIIDRFEQLTKDEILGTLRLP
jgi:nitrilase